MNWQRIKTSKAYIWATLIGTVLAVIGVIQGLNWLLTRWAWMDKFWVGFGVVIFIMMVVGAYVFVTSTPDIMEMVNAGEEK